LGQTEQSAYLLITSEEVSHSRIQHKQGYHSLCSRTEKRMNHQGNDTDCAPSQHHTQGRLLLPDQVMKTSQSEGMPKGSSDVLAVI
jgi:hypothetical protein